MVPTDWIEHRRPGDGELVGWIRPEGDAWVAVSLLGRDASAASDWTAAEQALERLGIGWLAGVWQLDLPAGAARVRIVRVAADGITVQADDFGAVDVDVQRFDLPWPAPPELRPAGESASSPFPSEGERMGEPDHQESKDRSG